MQIDIELERCVCIHSLSQIVDITLQVLLYQRRIIPLPVQNLLVLDSKNQQQQKSAKFKNSYQEITKIIRSTFCFYNRFNIHEFLIIIGSTPYLPKEIYRIPICACNKHNKNNNQKQQQQHVMTAHGDMESHNHNNQNGCGEHCQALTNKEKRQIFSSITLNKNASNMFANCSTCSTDKVFFFIKSDKTSTVNLDVDGIEEDESFELPNLETIKRRKIQQLQVDIRSICDDGDIGGIKPKTSRQKRQQSEANNLIFNNFENLNFEENNSICMEENDEKWFRIIQFISRFV